MNICRTLCPQAWLCGLADKSVDKEDVEVFDTGLVNEHTLNDPYNGAELIQINTPRSMTTHALQEESIKRKQAIG